MEEVVVSDVCRGKQLGKLWVKTRLWLVFNISHIAQHIKRQFYILNSLWFLLLKLFTSLLYPNRLVSVLTLLSKKLNCYKITLECAPKNVAFYQKFGYSASDETYMQCRFFDWERKFKKKNNKNLFWEKRTVPLHARW